VKRTTLQLHQGILYVVSVCYVNLQVVSIAEEKNTRIVSGNLQPRANNNQFALLAPRDSRVPRIDIPISQCPKGRLVYLLVMQFVSITVSLVICLMFLLISCIIQVREQP